MSLELREMEGVSAPYLEGGPWINSDALDIADLRGKVVLVEFWSMTCQSCMRAAPFLRDWLNRYRDEGLRIISVHSPRFEFEKDWENLEPFCRENDISWPVMMDNDRRTWSAYQVPAWPWFFLVGGDGVIRLDHAGAADYSLLDETIVRLLAEVNPDMRSTLESLVEHHHDTNDQTCYTFGPDMYCGYAHDRLGNPEGFHPERVWPYRDPEAYEDDKFYLHGNWEARPEFVRLASPSDEYREYMAFISSGPEVNAVIGPVGGRRTRVFITVDGGPVPSSMAGRDLVIDSGYCYVNADRPGVYQFIRNNDQSRHLIRLTSDDRFAVYQVTFGGCLER